MKMFALSIAGVPIRMELQEAVPMTDAFRPFLTEAEPVYTGRFRRVEELPEHDPAVLYTGTCYRVHPGGVRSFFDVQLGPKSYAVSRTDYEAGTVQVQYLPWGEHCVSQMDNSFFHLGFEGLLIRQDRVCFHAACISTDQGGILFSGPSTTGERSSSTVTGPFCSGRKVAFWPGGPPMPGLLSAM